jgi:hypothetical protein
MSVTVESYYKKLQDFSLLYGQQYNTNAGEVLTRLNSQLDNVTVIHFITNYNNFDYYVLYKDYGRGNASYMNLVNGYITNYKKKLGSTDYIGSGKIKLVPRTVPLLYVAKFKVIEDKETQSDIHEVVYTPVEVEGNKPVKTTTIKLETKPDYVFDTSSLPTIFQAPYIYYILAGAVIIWYFYKK